MCLEGDDVKANRTRLLCDQLLKLRPRYDPVARPGQPCLHDEGIVLQAPVHTASTSSCCRRRLFRGVAHIAAENNHKTHVRDLTFAHLPLLLVSEKPPLVGA